MAIRKWYCLDGGKMIRKSCECLDIVTNPSISTKHNSQIFCFIFVRKTIEKKNSELFYFVVLERKIFKDLH